MQNELVTLSKWLRLSPQTQGYVWYMQAELPGSELKSKNNPYKAGTAAYAQFEEGVRRGILEAQDSEE